MYYYFFAIPDFFLCKLKVNALHSLKIDIVEIF